MSKLSLTVALFATTFCLFQDSVEATCCAHCISGCRKHPGGCDSLCSTEYRLVNFICVPRCGGNCRQGYCYGVNDCRLCRPGYHVNLGGTCDPGTCDPHCTDTAKCARAGTCYTQLCVPGYAYNAYLYYCVPVGAQTTGTAGPSQTAVTAGTSTASVLQTTSVAASMTVAPTTGQTTGTAATTPAQTTGTAAATSVPATTPPATTPGPTTAAVTTPALTTVVTTPAATTVVTTIQTTMQTTAPLCQPIVCNGTCSHGAGTCDSGSCIPNYITDTSFHCQECDPYCVPTVPGGCYSVATTYYPGTCSTSCVSYYTVNTATYQCQPCATGCPTCPSAGTCNPSACPAGTVYSSGNCLSCGSHCNACSTPGYCVNGTSCAQGYGPVSSAPSQCGACAAYCNGTAGCYSNGAGKCDTGGCAVGYALDPSTKTCLLCQAPPNCNAGTDCSATGPATCASGHCGFGFTYSTTTYQCT